MYRWIKFAMRNAGLIFLAMIMIIAGGLYANGAMKMEEMPNVDIPYLQVVVPYPGATPAQGLDNVGKPLEQGLAGLKGLKNLYLTSGSSYVAATLEFDLNVAMDQAEKDVNSALATLKLPDGVQKPQLSLEGPNAVPVVSFGITGNVEQSIIQQYVDEHVKPLFASVQGIAAIDVQGTAVKQLNVKLDPAKLKTEQLSLDQVKQALQANNIGIPAGQVTLDGKALNVEVGSKLKSIADAQNMNLVIVEQDMSSLSNAFKSVGDGFGADR
ncbi:MAG: efflux RND transporter permease subunit, partial [Peptococcaceae bacterium]|nr:efflux RND transporter permease subunit [Peptococcaceae bacterium]